MPANLVARLCDLQNSDGGWGYGRGSSWTEPTAMALIALRGEASSERNRVRAIEFLTGMQRSDGGWGPKRGVDASTWVTLYALIVPGLPGDARSKAAAWLTAQSDRTSWISERLRTFLLGGTRPEGMGEGSGWSFYPGTAGWTMPTALSIVALQHAARSSAAAADRLEAGVRFLLSRRCSDGGWNHGSARALGYDVPAYPESTGQALLALRGRKWPHSEASVACAERLYAEAASVEAAAWLELGLRAQGRVHERELPKPRSTTDLALTLMTEAARSGVDVFAV